VEQGFANYDLQEADISLLRSLLEDASKLPSHAQDSTPKETPTTEPRDPRLQADESASFLQALEVGNTHGLFQWLLDADGAAYSWCASLEPTTFSEFLRCLDPEVISATLDPTGSLAISYGMATRTPLGSYVDEFGIKRLYHILWIKLAAIFHKRRGMGHRLVLNDYYIMMRSAAAASRPSEVKKLWLAMEADGVARLRQSESYAEFMQARWLTQSLYTQHDKARARLDALFLVKKSSQVEPPKDVYNKLHDLRIQRHGRNRFGQDPSEPDSALPLRYKLQSSQSLSRLYAKAFVRDRAQDTRLVRAFIIALGRNGSFRPIEQLLTHYWQIGADDPETAAFTFIPQRLPEQGSAHTRIDSPSRVTVDVMDGIVQAYGAAGRISDALSLIQYISRRFSIRIPDSIWFELLGWTYVTTSSPVKREWRKVASRMGKTPRKDDYLELFKLAVSDPHNAVPGFSQYHSLILTLINLRLREAALYYIRKMWAKYESQLHTHEAAMLELSLFLRQGVSSSSVEHKSKTAGATKWHLWWCFHRWLNTLLIKTVPQGHDDDFIVRQIPKLVEEFRTCMPDKIRYPTANGEVLLSDPAAVPKTVLRAVEEEVYKIRLNPVQDDPSALPTDGGLPGGVDLSSADRTLVEAAPSATVEDLIDDWIEESTENGTNDWPYSENASTSDKVSPPALRVSVTDRYKTTGRKRLRPVPILTTPDLRTLDGNTSPEWMMREFL
jgi:hypothetical protein